MSDDPPEWDAERRPDPTFDDACRARGAGAVHPREIERRDEHARGTGGRKGGATKVSAELQSLYEQFDMSLTKANADGTWNVPVPATSVIDGAGDVRASHVDADDRERMEPTDIRARGPRPVSRPRGYRASWSGVVLAETDDAVHLEGNVYFPRSALVAEHFRASRARSLCFWKGIASYSDVVVDDVVVPRAAWYYPHPSPLARRIKGRVAFSPGVTVEAK